MKSKKYRHSRKKIGKQKRNTTIKRTTRKYRKRGGVLFPGEKIKKFITERRQKMTANFLKSICSDSGVCIAFGTENEKIKKFFNGFSSFDDCIPDVWRLSRGNNGFVSELKYKRENYIAYAILKSSIRKEPLETSEYNSNSDNLAYEYIVGEFLNKMGKMYPCFLETYGIFRYINDSLYNNLEKQQFTFNTPKSNFKTGLQEMKPENPMFLSESCLHFNKLCVLVQHIKDAKNLHEMLKLVFLDINQEPLFINQELLFILYQIYMPLAFLANKFTHYDLHSGNVLLYKPIDNGFIEYHYHLPDKPTTSFKSRYLVKIIDYGRCFFNETPKNNSLLLYNALCKKQECNETEEAKIKRIAYRTMHKKKSTGSARNCGLNNGYNFLDKEKKEGHNFFISSQKRNKSHDLRLLFNIREFFRNYLEQYPGTVKDELVNFIHNVKYDTMYGTKEMETDSTKDVIHNVEDAFEQLNIIINSESNRQINASAYPYFKKIGDLHIYTDGRPVEFIPLSESQRVGASELPVPNFSPLLREEDSPLQRLSPRVPEDSLPSRLPSLLREQDSLPSHLPSLLREQDSLPSHLPSLLREEDSSQTLSEFSDVPLDS
jgi:hypothetical protein